MDSQWYTAIGALLLGLYVDKFRWNKQTQIVVYACIFVVFSILSLKFGASRYAKDVFTALSGIGFCGAVFNVSMILNNKENTSYRCIATTAGTLAFWLYLIHMKVGLVLEWFGSVSVVGFVVTSIIISMMSYFIYSFLQNKVIATVKYIKSKRYM